MHVSEDLKAVCDSVPHDRTDELPEAEIGVLQCGLDDWVSMACVWSVSMYYAEMDGDKSQKLVVMGRVLRRLLWDGLMVVGDLGWDDEFRAWAPDYGPVRCPGDVSAVCDWIVGEVASSQPKHLLGDWGLSIWLDLTEPGRRMVEGVPLVRYLTDDDWPYPDSADHGGLSGLVK